MSVENTLYGSQLEAFIDRVEADLEEAGSAVAVNLRERLQAQALRADSLSLIARLCSLWLRADDASAASAVLEHDGAKLLEASNPAERASLAMNLAIYRLQLGGIREDEKTCLEALAQMQDLLAQLPEGLTEYRTLDVLDSVEHQSLDLALAVIEFRRKLDEAIPERSRLRAWDSVIEHQRRALAYRRAKRLEDARNEALAAVSALESLPADQAIGQDDWLGFANTLIEIAPEALPSFSQPVMQLTRDLPIAQRREYEVRLARLKARALHAQGDLAGAIAACAAARYSLSSDGGDDFVEYEVPWLVEAGRSDEAGRRAFAHIYQSETQLDPAIGRIVHERLAAADDTSFWWPACVLRASTYHETLHALISAAPVPFEQLPAFSSVHSALFDALKSIPPGQREEPSYAEMEGDIEQLDTPEWQAACDRILQSARALCETRSPGNPWITRIAAYADRDAGRIDTPTLVAQFDQAIKAGDMRDNRSINGAFFALAGAKGILEALRQPIPDMPSGLWSYNFVVDAEDNIEEQIEQLSDAEQQEAKTLLHNLKRTVYERGIAHMERYFNTGIGHPYDACAHLYSMMCNNLGIVYYHESRYDESIDLHWRGIAASSFAEHYDGIFMCKWMQEDHAGIVKAAEDLWLYAMEYGYGRHKPNRDIPVILRSLGRLDRHDEKTIWLERLIQWQRENGEDETNLSHDALEARVDSAVYLGASFPNEAIALWKGVEAQVRASNDYDLLHNSGSGAYNRDDFELAIELFTASLKCNPRETEEQEESANFVTETIEKAKQKLADARKSGKRFWQFWK
ncbi:hypothetical protein [Niveibacterium terrae]|uniref:hypothetical protein n=1 Tax=Niveibacterium terrae TaxID=3373598 RepID=UPI003A906A05